MRPESCFWKPQMILISVDLPAPLSPRRPSTSPLRTCRLTSRSAVTGPKRLAKCSTRRTSSGADVGPTIGCSVGASPGWADWSRSAATGLPPADAAHEHVCGHRHDHGEACVEEQVVGLYPLEDQAILEDAQEERADQCADDCPRASREQRAADHRRGDGQKQDFVW